MDRHESGGVPHERDPRFDPATGVEMPETATRRRSLGSLIGDLATETRLLVKQEARLARTEVSEKISLLERSSLLMALGAVFGVAAVLTLAAALANGLTALLAQVLPLDVAVWLGPLILAAALGGVAYALIERGRKKLRTERLALDRTADSLREDTRWIKEKVT